MFKPNTAESTNQSNNWQNTQSTTSTQFPEYTQQANQNLAGAAWNMLSPQLKSSPFQVAGFTPDQTMGFDLTRDMAYNQFTPNQNINNSANALASGQAGRVNPAQAQAAQAQAAQLDPNAYKPFMNPFLDSVGKSTLGAMRNEYQNADAGLAGKYAAGQAFGGSGEAIARGQAARGYNENVGQAISGLMSQGYDRATASAMANAQMQQQTNLANAQMQQQSGMANAQMEQQSGMANAQMEQALPLLFDRLQGSQQQRQQGALQDLLGIGNQQQQFQQTVLDTPNRALQMLAGLTPNVYNQTQQQNTSQSGGQTGSATAPAGGPSTMQQLLGFGLDTLGKAGSKEGNWLTKLLG